MSTTNEQDQVPSAQQGGPADVPAERHSSLDRLDVLVGQWEMEGSFEAGFFGPGSPAMTSRGGTTTFQWLEGRFFLTQRFVMDNPAAPSGLAIIGMGTEPETFTQHYYDSRGVSRLYQMSLDGGVWRVWHGAPGFWQRYTGHVSEDHSTIAGAWEKSADGQDWDHDFGLTYIKVGPAA